MYCTKCGKPLPEGSRFCTGCGAPVGVGSGPETAPVPEPVPPAEAVGAPEPVPAPPEEPPKKKKTGKVILIAVLAVVLAGALLLAAAVGVGIWLFTRGQESQTSQAAQPAPAPAVEAPAYADALERGEAYLRDMDLEAAVRRFQEVLEQDGDNVPASLGLAECYLRQGYISAARSVLTDVKNAWESAPRGDNPLYEDGNDSRLERLWRAACFDPYIDRLDLSDFPRVSVELVAGGAGGYDGAICPEGAAIYEGGVRLDVTDMVCDGDRVTVSYTADPAKYDGEDRWVETVLWVEGIPFSLETLYNVPDFEDAFIQMMSTDVSDYPTVRVYYRVEDGYGETVTGLDGRAFQIRERLSGGEYLSREVHAVSDLERRGLNIDLVADKSGSISYSDMEKIRWVMTQFIYGLDYAAGDRAEVLAFDSIVQQMCCYTDRSDLLANGVASMTPDGMTSLYQALRDGVYNAALQGGARCVIAFTDGQDTEGGCTPEEVIRYARASQVPIYIVGVGYGVEESTLSHIAYSTGGRYWYIDDLSDLEGVLATVYGQQKELYVVEYESDGGWDPYASRELEVTVSGRGCTGRNTSVVEPVRSLQETYHPNRYEVVAGVYTWEEARRLCQEMGGHLATVTSPEEQEEIAALAEAQELRYLWLGGYTSHDFDGSVFGHWITGEPFKYQCWDPNEPSRLDVDGTEEWYIMLWDVYGTWSWNDQRNDPAAVAPALTKHMGFVCEFENG